MLGVIGGVVNKAQEGKQQKADIKSAEKLAEQENATLTKIEKDKIDLKKQELASSGNPTNIVLNNPNLTPEEKATALKQIEIVEEKGTESNTKKYLMYGGIALLGFFLFRSFSKK
jgi:putative NADH-flavin reductase